MNAPAPRDERIDAIAEQFARDTWAQWVDHLSDERCRHYLMWIAGNYPSAKTWSDFGLHARTVIAVALDEAAREQLTYEEHEGEEA